MLLLMLFQKWRCGKSDAAVGFMLRRDRCRSDLAVRWMLVVWSSLFDCRAVECN